MLVLRVILQDNTFSFGIFIKLDNIISVEIEYIYTPRNPFLNEMQIKLSPTTLSEYKC